MSGADDTSLAARVLRGEVRAAARLMRLVDDGAPQAREELERLFPHAGRAHVVGFTGNPGSGKSTLVDRFIARCRAEDLTVGVVAIDPTSPFSGGAILGDRIRMQRHTLDKGVFIRSVATRGNLGGLSRSTPAVVQIFDAMGFDVIVIETVGVGQDEIDVVAHADTCVVVTVPGLGDDIQATKAGILEIADLFVVNKADRPGADRLVRELRAMLHLGQAPAGDDEPWEVPVLKTVANTGEGIDALFDAVRHHRAHEVSDARRADALRGRYQHLVRLIASGEFDRRMARVFGADGWRQTIDDVVAHEVSPYEAADRLLEAMFSE